MSSKAQFKNIRNRIQRHNGTRLLNELLYLLNRPDANTLDRQIHYPSWLLLLLLKWIVLYGIFGDSHTTANPKPNDLNHLVNKLHELSGSVRKPTEYRHWLLFMRNMAFQQFWLQQVDFRQGMGRQCFLFRSLNSDHTFRKSFYDLSGISIDDFLELSWALVSLCSRKDKQKLSFKIEVFGSLEQTYGRDTITQYLNMISISLGNARQWLLELEAQKDPREQTVDYEFYEQTPFTRYPLLREDDTYVCISPFVLQNSLQTFIYDVLRQKDPSAFMDKFGPAFERLVSTSLQTLTTPLITEADLQKKFSNVPNLKFVDFILVDNDTNILIDAKGIAMSWTGMVTHLPGTIRSQLRTSVLKGIEQSYALSSQLSNESQIGSVLLGKKNNYLLVVTYKDVFALNGRVFRDLIAPEEMDAIIAKYGGIHWIPLEHIYFLSIDELDMLLSCCKQLAVSPVKILEGAVETDSNLAESQRMFMFRQHVMRACEMVEALPHVNDAFEDLHNRLLDRL